MKVTPSWITIGMAAASLTSVKYVVKEWLYWSYVTGSAVLFFTAEVVFLVWVFRYFNVF